MRILPSVSRRGVVHAFAAWALSSSPMLSPVTAPCPASALVDGIPLYAPGDKIKLPDYGFEVQLPRLELLRDRTLPSLRDAIERDDWQGAAEFIGIAPVQAQLQLLGETSSILGDEAYTALALKGQYAATVKRLQAAVVSSRRNDALRELDSLETVVVDYLALVPQKVVALVRARERKLAGLSTETAEIPLQPEASESSKQASGGLLIAPSNDNKICGRDIRC